MTGQQELMVPADFEALRQVAPWVQSGFPDADHGPIELALQELMVNIVEHAYGGDGSPGSVGDAAIVVAATSDGGGAVTFTVTDEGEPPSEQLAARPDPETPQVGGYGLVIIEQLTTLFTHRRAEGQNIWTLTFPPPGP